MNRRKQAIASVFLILIALASFFVVAPKASNPENYRSTIAYLDEKADTVIGLTGGVTAASLVLGAIPGDSTTPIADELMDTVDYFIIILCTVFLEKCILSIAGYVAFRWLIPIACLFFLIFIWARMPLFYRLAFKIAVFGMALFLVVPASVKASQLIEATNDVTIQNAIDSLHEIAQTEEETEVETEVASQIEEGVTEAEESSSGIMGWISSAKESVSEAADSAKDAVASAAETVVSSTKDILAKAETVINVVMQTVMVMMVTSCLIPILVLFVLWTLLRQIIAIKLEAPDLDNFRRIEE